MDITELCGDLHNWFDIDGMGRQKSIKGTFTITGGALDLQDFVLERQYFRVVGSAFNDGAHRYGDNDLTDETFSGEITAMYIPKEVFDLLQEMNDWQDKYGEAVNSPYNSESFGGYSYSKAGAGDILSGSDGRATGVKSVFAHRLNKWRKV